MEIPQYVLNDLCSRFIINIPSEERSDLVRIFFQIELAHWFYLDFYCTEVTELTPCGIKEFSSQIFNHCPFLSEHADHVDKILEEWKSYKFSVPTYGAILLDPGLNFVLLAQGFKSKSSWSFPKGKVNEGESPYDCAIREVFEETGYHIEKQESNQYYIELVRNNLTRLYVIPDIPMDTTFLPQSRNEIKSLQWFPVNSLPTFANDVVCKTSLNMNSNSFFMIIPFMKDLKRWISIEKENRKKAYGTTSTVGKQKSRLSDDGQMVAKKESSKNRRKTHKLMSDEQNIENQRQLFAEQNRMELLNLYSIKVNETGTKGKLVKAEGSAIIESGASLSGEQITPTKQSRKSKPQKKTKSQSKPVIYSPIPSTSTDLRVKEDRIQQNSNSGYGPQVNSTDKDICSDYEIVSNTWKNFKLDVSKLLKTAQPI